MKWYKMGNFPADNFFYTIRNEKQMIRQFKKIHTVTAAIFALLLLTFHPAQAEKMIAVGDTVPVTAALPDQTGTMQNLKDLYGENGALLVFYRSADWCPYCKAQLIELRNEAQKIESHGLNIIGISYDPVEKLARFAEKRDIDFRLLSDKDSTVIRQFGILDETQREGSFAYGVPKPAVYVVDEKGIINAILAEDSYKTRPQIDVIMDEIFKMNGGR